MKKTNYLLLALFFMFFISCNNDDPKELTRVEIIVNSLNQGITPQQLLGEGYTVEELLEAQVSISDLLDADVSVSDLIEANVPLNDLLTADVPVSDLLEAEISVADLKAGGVDASELYAAGIKLADLLTVGFTNADLDGLEGTVTDFDDNTYKTVIIGNQVWMAQNLKTLHYSNGDEIPTTSPIGKDLDLIDVPKYQWTYGGSVGNMNTYGLLYTWFVATDSRNVCPTGWHVPSEDEWTTLRTYLGGTDVAGGKMKSTELWESPNTGATNESGFTGLPGGYRDYNGGFSSLTSAGWFWTSTSESGNNALIATLSSQNAKLFQDNVDTYKKDAVSIRCVKD